MWTEDSFRITYKSHERIPGLTNIYWELTGFGLCSGKRWYGMKAARKCGWIWSYWTREVTNGIDNLSICVYIITCKTINCRLEHLNLPFRHLSHLKSLRTVENIDYCCPTTKKMADVKGAQRQAVKVIDTCKVFDIELQIFHLFNLEMRQKDVAL